MVVLAAIATGIERAWPAPRNCMTCTPALSVSVTGVTPRVSPSTITCAPAGFVMMLTVPVPDGAAAGAKIQRAAMSATIATTAVTTAAIATGRGMRLFFVVAYGRVCLNGVAADAGGALHSDASASISGGGSL